MEKKNTLLLTVIAVATLLVAVVGATFAYFGSFDIQNTNRTNVNVETGASASSSFVTNAAKIKINVLGNEMLKGTDANATQVGIHDGDTDTDTLTVNLTAGDENTTTTCTYDVMFAYTGTDFYGTGTASVKGGTAAVGAPQTAGTDGKEFTYEITNDTVEHSTVELVKTGIQNFADFKDSKTTPVKVASGVIKANATSTVQSYTFTVKFYNFPTIDQSDLQNKKFVGDFYVANEFCSTDAGKYVA